MLHRIQWDPAWRGSVFEFGYLDRVAGAIVRVPLDEPRLESGAPSSVTCLDPDGDAVHIPLHRIRTVWRDGAVIWQRPSADRLE